MPISRVRSVTVTSMMFITPMPPTNSEMAATMAEQEAEQEGGRLAGLQQAGLVEDDEVGRLARASGCGSGAGCCTISAWAASVCCREAAWTAMIV